MKIAYISGPYRSSSGDDAVWTNIMEARRVARKWWKKEDISFVVCPHINSMFMDGTDIPSERFIAGDIAFIRERMQPTDFFVLLPGWQGSEGARKELAVARAVGCQIIEEPALDDPMTSSPTMSTRPSTSLPSGSVKVISNDFRGSYSTAPKLYIRE